MTPETNVDERALQERFAALEHPPEEQDWAEVLRLARPPARRRPPRRRRPLLALAAALAVAVVAGAAASVVVNSGPDGPAREEAARPASATGEPLTPLPEGSPVPGPESERIVERVTLDEMIERAEIVFIGSVEAVGGSERVAGLEPEFTTHRVRFLVERPLRGIGEGFVDITEFDSSPFVDSGLFAYDYAPRDRYLVFAERRRLGTEETPVLVPVGYMQGVYRMTGDDTAENEANGEVKLSELEKRLAD